MAAEQDFLPLNVEVKIRFEFTNHVGKQGKVILCIITNRQIEGLNDTASQIRRS